jgi:hypothetical protein
MFDRSNFPRIVGTREVAAMLNVSTQRVDQLAREPASSMSRLLPYLDDEPRFIEAGRGKRLAFPTPVAELACGRIWLADEIEAWQQASRPITSPPPGGVPARDAAMPSADPWDADAVRWLLFDDRFEGFSPAELLAYLRQQPAMVKRNPKRARQAQELAWSCDMHMRPDPGGHTIHLFRPDPQRPTYPGNAAERRAWLRAH